MAIPQPPTGAWKTIKGMIADTIGPMAILGIAAQKFVSASREAATNAQRMQEVLGASEGAAKLRMQFEQLLGSATAARKQVEMLAKVASSGAFSFEALGEASKNLQVLTNGALNSQKGLKQVEDAAAATGTPVDAMAVAVGQLYSALKENSGVEQAARQLQQLGAISQETVQKLKGLSDAGVSISASWQTVEADLKKAAGAASALGGTLAGLEAQMQAIRQQSDARIGDMFIEAEVAAKQAEIGFAKFKAAVAEANAGPWAALETQLGGVKKAVGDFVGAMAQTGAVKSTFEAIAGVAVAVLGGLYLGLMAAIPMLLKFAGVLGGTAVAALSKFAASVGISTAALGGMAKALKGVLFNPLTVFLTVAAGLFINLASKAYAAAKSVQELKKTFRSLQAERNQGYGDARADSTARTPEERDAGIKAGRDRIAQSDVRKEQLREQIKKEQEFRSQSFLGVTSMAERDASEERERMARRQIDAEDTFQDYQRNAIADLAGNPMAADQESLKISQERLKLEQQILAAAKERLQSVVSPDVAVKVADQNMQVAQKEMEYAESAQENRYNDNQKLSEAARKFEESRGARDKYVTDVDNKIKTGREEILAVTPTSQQFEVNRAIEKNDLGELRRQAKIGALDEGMVEEYIQAVEAKQKNPSGPALDFDAFNTGAASDSGKIQAEIAKRAALQQEEKDLLRNKDFAGVEKVRAKMSELVNPLTGESELSGNKEAQTLMNDRLSAVLAGDQEEVNRINRRLGEVASSSMGVSDQRLQTDLKTANEKEDVVGKQAALEQARIAKQAAEVAKAAAKGEVDAASRRLAIERQISALRGGGSEGEQAAIDQEYQDSVSRTAEKRDALKAQDAAALAYNELAGSEAAKALPAESKNDTEEQKTLRAQLEAARAAFEAAERLAAEKGVKAGDTTGRFDLDDEAAKERKAQQTQALRERSASQMGQLQRNRGEAARARSGRDDSAAERASGVASEGEARMQNIRRAEEAAREFKAAQAKGDTEGMNAAKIKQAATGFGGMGLDEIEQIKAAEQEILALKRQQSIVDQAAAAARKQAAMDEVKFSQMRNQITVAGALGKTAGSEFDVREQELQNERSKAEKALPIAQQKEALTVQADKLKTEASNLRAGGNEAAAAALDAQAEALIKKRDELEAALARIGFGGAAADDIEGQVANINAALEANSTDRLAARQSMAEDQRVQAARIAEKYAPTQQARDEAMRGRKKAEDDQFYNQSLKEFTDAGYEENDAKSLAANATKMNRLQSDLDEAGTPEVDDLTRIGGNAAKVGLFPNATQDKQEQLRDLAQQQADKLDKIIEYNLRGLALAEKEQLKAK